MKIPPRRIRQKLAALTVFTLLLAFGFVSARIPAASANVNLSGPGPSVAVDRFGHRYALWKGTDGGLWEASYNGIRWFGPTEVVGKNANMGSEPTVAVSYIKSTGGSNPGAYVFVFWKGAGSAHNLHEEYYNGSWHGPFDIGMGNLGASAVAPSATGIAGGTQVLVAWAGSSDTHIYYTVTASPTNVSSWTGPIKSIYNNVSISGWEPTVNDTGGGAVQVFWPDAGLQNLWGGHLLPSDPPTNYHDGPLGTSPTSAGFADTISLTRYAEVYWEGIGGGLWGMEYGPFTGNTGAQEYYSGQLGSAPSVTLPQSSTGPNDTRWYWICPNDHNLCQLDTSGKLTDLGFGPIPSP